MTACLILGAVLLGMAVGCCVEMRWPTSSFSIVFRAFAALILLVLAMLAFYAAHILSNPQIYVLP